MRNQLFERQYEDESDYDEDELDRIEVFLQQQFEKRKMKYGIDLAGMKINVGTRLAIMTKMKIN